MYGDDRKGPKRRQTRRLGSTTAALGTYCKPHTFQLSSMPIPSPKKTRRRSDMGKHTRLYVLFTLGPNIVGNFLFPKSF